MRRLAALAMGFPSLVTSPSPASARTAAPDGHAPHVGPLRSPSVAGALAGPATAPRLSPSTRAPSLPPPSPACPAAPPGPRPCRRGRRGAAAADASWRGASQRGESPGTVPAEAVSRLRPGPGWGPALVAALASSPRPLALLAGGRAAEEG